MSRRRPYPLTRRQARRYVSPYALARRSRRRGPAVDPKALAGVAGAVAVFAAVHAGTAHGSTHGTGGGARTDVIRKPARSAPPASGAETRARQAVLAYAGQQVTNKVPYVWGGTTTSGMDCSGLSMNAWASAGVSISRTSQQQWATEKHVPESQVKPGDLVFFPGSDGTWSAPGHVGIVTDPSRHQMVDEYATGYVAESDGYGPAATQPGLADVVGFTDPEAS